MSDVAIRLENLSKKYEIAVGRDRHNTLRDQLSANLRTLFKGNGRSHGSMASFWALKNISLTVGRAEVLGIIGRNGAGKSTLLKILSRITEPTAGQAELYGRVASLLEVGTGFHAELTGRENIYLSGAILGMMKSEIEQKFDEIVAFSEVDKFLDTPVKRYSSGMYVRLAFAVAAHLESEILIVDEVLAVGDASFQKKCLGKMDHMAKEGRTVLLVSHNMGSIGNLCRRALWLENGEIRLTGDPAYVISQYLSSGAVTCSVWINSGDSCSTEAIQRFELLSIRLLSDNNQPSPVVQFDKPFSVEITYNVAKPIRDLVITQQLKDLQGNVICGSWDTDTNGLRGSVWLTGRYHSICKLPGKLLKPGRYLLSVAAHNHVDVLAMHNDVLVFDISEVGYHFNPGRAGAITPTFEWETGRIDEAHPSAR